MYSGLKLTQGNKVYINNSWFSSFWPLPQLQITGEPQADISKEKSISTKGGASVNFSEELVDLRIRSIILNSPSDSISPLRLISLNGAS